MGKYLHRVVDGMTLDCPVCKTVHADRVHLAHHIAFQAMVHADDHESWLADRIETWESMEPSELGAQLGDILDVPDPEPHPTEPMPQHPVLDRHSIPTLPDVPENEMSGILDEAERLTRAMHGEDRPGQQNISSEE